MAAVGLNAIMPNVSQLLCAGRGIGNLMMKNEVQLVSSVGDLYGLPYDTNQIDISNELAELGIERYLSEWIALTGSRLGFTKRARMTR